MVRVIRETKGRSKGQEAVFCDGSCQMWLHRCCAGLSRKRFEAVASSEEPFLCPACQRSSQQETITLLKDDVAALRAELFQLKESVVALQVSKLNDCAQPKENSSSWNVVVGRGAKRPPRKRTAAVDESKSTMGKPDAAAQQSSTHRQRKRVAIPDARRIWGTMRTTTRTAVINALKQLTTVDVTKLTVKRKFKTAANDPTRVLKWWFIVRGEEDLLQQVDGAWNTVAVQTAWKLEPAYMYEDKDTAAQQRRDSVDCTDTTATAVENPTLDNALAAGIDHPTIQTSKENEQSPITMDLTNSDHAPVPLEAPTTPAPLDTTPSLVQ